MAIIFSKGSVSGLLKALGAKVGFIEQVIKSDFTLNLGISSIKLVSGYETETIQLGATVESIILGKVTEAEKIIILGKVVKKLQPHLQVIANPKYTEPTPDLVANAEMEQVIKAMAKVTTSEATNKIPNYEEVKALQPVALRDAVYMYQPVLGTSHSSIYSVVALTDSLAMAVKLGGNNISVRVEGNISTEDKLKLATVGLTDKGAYLSGHFDTQGKCDASRVLGAILLGCGIDYNTPLPKLSMIGA